MAKTSISVDVKNGDIEKALGNLKKKIASGGTHSRLRDRRFYLSPHKKRKKQAKEAKRSGNKKDRYDR